MARESYDHASIEKNAQEKWARLHLYETDLSDTSKEPYYLLNEFPYPSGDLHIGHWYAFALTDIFARFKRMQGKNVLYPFGFDAFGLPAENAAIKRGLDPKEWTYQNMATMRTQIQQMGSSLDWSKEVVTCDPEYYKWTQWLFSKLFEHDLAERRLAAVKWCPKDQTVLANEQVIDGHCERCGTLVEERNLTQWFLKITQYAARLLADLEPLPWRQEIKEAQRAWIGESEGARLFFNLKALTNDDAGVVEVFTTRPDTIFGVTYVVIAPEHPLVTSLLPLTTNAEEIEAYRRATTRKTERERSENKDKTGVRMGGLMAINPANNQEIPLYIADYVLASYGTGAVMAVPAHDERDFEFAKKFDLPMYDVVIPSFVDTQNPPRENKPIVTRRVILAIVHNPKTNKYLALKWKEQPWTTFITGGIDEGEDPVDAAIREIQEETGYQNVKLIRTLGGPLKSEFFATHKDENRIAYVSNYLFELKNEKKGKIASEELAKHEPAWLSLEEIRAECFRHAEIEYVLERLQSPEKAYTEDGELFNSGEFTGRNNREAMSDIITAIGGEKVTNYRIRDWLVSRQRYWGCPIPIVYDPEGKAHLVPAEHLPWLLPTDVDFTPTGKSPLASSKELHERVERIFGVGWVPEYDTLDTFVDSSWYYLRYLDPHNTSEFSNQKLMKQWLPVDRYSGGSEHTTMHLLYARFFHKALHDLALVPTSEPFNERFNRGIILGSDGAKMSKSKGNVVNPDEFVKKYGADAVRIYLAFIGPYNEAGSYPWSLEGVESMRRFLDRIVGLSSKVIDETASVELTRALAKTVEKVSSDTERFKFNTAIAALMILLKELEKQPKVSKAAYLEFLKLLAPYAPHLTEHLFEEVVVLKDSAEESIHSQEWPVMREGVAEDTVRVTVQINGKRRGEVYLSPTASEEEVLEAAKNVPQIMTHLQKGSVVRLIYVPGRILNLVLEE